jgi:hypothetical protein
MIFLFVLNLIKSSKSNSKNYIFAIVFNSI